jgi:hypothetical protein
MAIRRKSLQALQQKREPDEAPPYGARPLPSKAEHQCEAEIADHVALMVVPIVFAARTSLSPVNAPAVTATVALARLRLSGSDKLRVGDKVTGPAAVKAAVAATPESCREPLTFVMVTVVFAMPMLWNGWPSLIAQVTVRVGFNP